MSLTTGKGRPSVSFFCPRDGDAGIPFPVVTTWDATRHSSYARFGVAIVLQPLRCAKEKVVPAIPGPGSGTFGGISRRGITRAVLMREWRGIGTTSLLVRSNLTYHYCRS